MSVFTPLKIGQVELPSRLIMAPFKTALGNLSGEIDEKNIAFYQRRASSALGAIISEPFYVDLRGREHPRQLGITADSYIPGLRRLTESIHEGGSLAVAHLNHAGRAANPHASGSSPEAPSDVICAASGIVPEIMTVGRIREIVGQYARAAGRAREAGFDIIEIQFGLGYLIAQFLSPYTNKRSDEYGIDGDNKFRFAGEILASIRETVGEDFPLIARISATEIIEDGLSMHDAFILAKFLEDNGVDALHVVSGSACDSGPWYYQHMRLPLGKNLAWAHEIKRKCALPVIVAGRMGTPAVIRETIDTGMIDAVALGRPLLTDPDFAPKMKANNDDDILLCGACLQGCLARVKSGEAVGCIVNPEAGNEHETHAAPKTSRKVVVVGAGPAGMQAALTAFNRGHKVVLFDRRKLGGMSYLSPLPPGKKMMERPVSGMINRIKTSHIELRIPRRATAELICAEKPDVVILAIGAVPFKPAIPGLKDVLFAEDVLTGRGEPGRHVLVIGGGLAGVECAEYLAGRRHKVMVVEILPEIAMDMEPIGRKLTLKMLEAQGVKLLTNTSISWFDGKKAYVMGREGEAVLGEFDTIVAAAGMRVRDDLQKKLCECGLDVKIIGDAKKPGQIFDAVRDGYLAAVEI